MPARDQPEGEQLERNEDRRGDEKGNERGVGGKLRDARLAPTHAGQFTDPRHAGLHGVPYPLLEKNPQRGQNRERAARRGGKNYLGVSSHFYAGAQGRARLFPLTPPLRPESRARAGRALQAYRSA